MSLLTGGNWNSGGLAATTPCSFSEALRRDAPPNAVQRLISDLKMAAAYRSADNWQEPLAMQKSFNAFSWNDPFVLAALPNYLNCPYDQRQRVDYAYEALFPTPTNPRDPKQAMMELWMKARLFSYDQVAPFQFNPYLRRDSPYT